MNLSRARLPRRNLAFNRIELFVVLTLCALLAVVTFPRFVAAAVQDAAAVCLNQQNQRARAWTEFANDHEGKLVNNFTLADTLATVSQKTYLNWANQVMDWTKASMNTNLNLIASSPLMPYLANDLEVLKCPADANLSQLQRQAGWSRRVRSCSMNGFIGLPTKVVDSLTAQGKNPLYPRYRQFLSLGSIPQPAHLFVFLDEHPDSINDGVFLNDPGNASTWRDLPAAFHNGSGSFAFADGHGELHPWQFARTKAPVRFSFESVFIPQSESADYQWLSDRSSVDPTTLGATRQADRQIQIVWSALPTNYLLQASDSLNSGNWTNVETAPVKGWGQNSVSLEVQGTQRFFRLVRP